MKATPRSNLGSSVHVYRSGFCNLQYLTFKTSLSQSQIYQSSSPSDVHISSGLLSCTSLVIGFGAEVTLFTSRNILIFSLPCLAPDPEQYKVLLLHGRRYPLSPLKQRLQRAP